ncbi:MAG: glycosyltransferase family 39 protein [Clostridia bacterium]|nr:glycosyltransferase family 39 protein [Clostridia bacterium]MBQ8637352.1 glycosyltransferase family 39 protein [Clostridia bacterium]
MIALIFTSIIYVIAGYLLMTGILEDKSKSANKKTGLFILLAAGLIIRYIGAVVYPGYEHDMNCFKGWADLMFKEGPGGFYTSDMFTDYPPVYMYVLWFIGALKNLIPMSDTAVTLLIKTPAIICDLLIGLLLFNVANRKAGEKTAYYASALWIFNPAVFINSSLWGQVDSVFTLLVFLAILLVTEKKIVPSFFVFAVSVMLKPQTLFYTPILLLAVAEETIYPAFKPKELLRYIGFGILAILFALAICVPFGLSNVIKQYIGTLSSYQYASVNAYNLWSALGLNWSALTPQMSFAGTALIAAVVILASVFFFNMKSESKYFWLGGFICFGVFVLAVKMHERYAFPVILLLLAGFVIDRKSRQKMWVYLAVTVTQIINAGYVLFYTIDGKNLTNSELLTARVMGFVAVGVFVWLLYSTVRMCTFKPVERVLAKKDYRIRKKDVVLILVLTAVYSAIALFNLGNMYAPETNVKLVNETKTFALNEHNGISGMKIFLGEYNLNEENTLKMELNNNEGENVYETELHDASVFCWDEYKFDLPPATELVLSTTGEINILEMAFIDKDGNVIGGEGELFDESALVPKQRDYKNSTYFDEIYHARTAYEFLEGDNVYEWTHPPLGKVIISIGIKLFGMNPFGWRIMGTLFGIMMVPVIYIFAKKLFGERYLSFFAAVLFTFDFMHFTQTRIATIDVYITFFIMLMYMFMLSYLREDFYGDIKKLLVPLGFSGISFGLGIASKWTGAYAGAGLAIIFFANLLSHYKEYKNGNLKAAIFPERAKTLVLFCIGAFVIIPVIIYMLSYIPFLRTEGVGIKGIWDNQIDMYKYHSTLKSEHSFSSPWYQWPIIYRPVWYYSSEISETMRGGISAMGNPLVWWAGIPAFFYTAYLAIRKRDKTAIFLSISYLAQLLPWVLVSRVTFIYHYFPCVPFVVLMLAFSADKLLGNSKKAKTAMALYLVGTVVLFVMFYPVLSGYPVSMDYVKTFLKWSNEWVLISGI